MLKRPSAESQSPDEFVVLWFNCLKHKTKERKNKKKHKSYLVVPSSGFHVLLLSLKSFQPREKVMKPLDVVAASLTHEVVLNRAPGDAAQVCNCRVVPLLEPVLRHGFPLLQNRLFLKIVGTLSQVLGLGNCPRFLKCWELVPEFLFPGEIVPGNRFSGELPPGERFSNPGNISQKNDFLGKLSQEFCWDNFPRKAKPGKLSPKKTWEIVPTKSPGNSPNKIQKIRSSSCGIRVKFSCTKLMTLSMFFCCIENL